MSTEFSLAQRRQIVIQAAALLAAYTGSSQRAAARLGLGEPAEAEADLSASRLTDDQIQAAFPRAQKVVEGVDRVVGEL